jgi:hypothetical protein
MKLTIKESVAYAKSQGLKNFQHHTPCLRCQSTKRYVANKGACAGCMKLWNAGVLNDAMTSKKARQLGIKKFDGKIHAACGSTTRYAANGRCIKCALENAKEQGNGIFRNKTEYSENKLSEARKAA